MARITFSIPDELSAAAEKRAKADRRTLSAYIAGLVEQDARNAGLLVNGDAALLELVHEAQKSGVDVLKVLAKARRAKG